jgi:hypothetical protein
VASHIGRRKFLVPRSAARQWRRGRSRRARSNHVADGASSVTHEMGFGS